MNGKKVVDMICNISSLDQRQLKDSEPLERLLNLERLQRLQSLQSQKRLILSNKSYEQVMIEPNSIIYCDIPYKGTNKYIFEFDHNKFYEWALNQPFKVYISEYDMPLPFYPIYEWNKRSTLGTGNKTKTVEKLFCNRKPKVEVYKQLEL